jgi:hypothetical protein
VKKDGELPPKEKAREHAMNNSSISTADRATHVKIVVVSLLCATVVAGIGIAAQVTDTSNVRNTSNVRDTSNVRIEASVTGNRTLMR